jgi:hypothetical protein
MVIDTGMIVLNRALLVAAQSADPLFERLDPPRRAAVVMALLGLTLIGLFLITFAMIGGHWVRRMARHRPSRRRAGTAAAASRQLTEALQGILPELKSGDTVLLDTPSKDTKAGN